MNSSSAGGIVLQPLLPAFSYTDILLPPLLIALSLLLHTIYNDPPPASVRAHLYRAHTAHARFLPTEAKHIFSYPVLFFGIDLKELEDGKLDMGRLFGYIPSGWRLTALRPDGYLDATPGKGLREKLWAHLDRHGVGRELARTIYTVTMPAYLGMEGINPLTVHFCYSENEGKGRRLEATVLEVHNTFGERHLYVLRSGEKEDETVIAGYEHQWTFPRAFHVSPFNDRTGFYRVSLTDPLLSTSDSPNSSFPSHPTLAIKIVFLTSTMEKKIYASLAGPSSPLTPGSLINALLRFPLSLLLTTPRILYQALRLHYSKRLDVFPRPEPFVGAVEGIVNPVEPGGKVGAVGWQGEGATEVLGRERAVAFLRRRVESEELKGRNLEINLVSADTTTLPITISSTGGSDAPIEVLTVNFLTPLFYSDLLACPTVALALAVGSATERRWTTTNDTLFLSLFQSSVPSSRASRLSQRLRIAIMEWGLSFDPLRTTPILTPSALPPHPLDDGDATYAIPRTLASHFLTLKVGYWVFVATNARFVVGTETWGDWSRWSSAGLAADVSSGSVLRT